MARTLSTLLAGLFLVGSVASTAQAAGHAAKAALYSQRNNVPMRTVTRRVGGRKITRIFVPVFNQKSAEDFSKIFADGKGMVLYNRPYNSETYPYNYYVRLITKGGGRPELWASYYDSSLGPKTTDQANFKRAIKPETGGRYVALNLGKKSVNHSRNFLKRFHLGSSYTNEKTAYEDAMRAEGKDPGDTAADCMWWLPNMQTGKDGRDLLQKLHSGRTRGPQEIAPKAIHSGQTRFVEVVGVGFKDGRGLRSFASMSEADLFGPAPSNGSPSDNVRLQGR